MRLIDADKLKEELDCWARVVQEPNKYSRDDAIYIIESQPTVNQWIPVSERLPKSEEEVEVTVVRKYKANECRFTCRAIYESGEVWSSDSYLNWDDLDDSTYNEDKDDWLVPEGWFESVSYREQFDVIDDKVIAWRELGKSYKGE